MFYFDIGLIRSNESYEFFLTKHIELKYLIVSCLLKMKNKMAEESIGAPKESPKESLSYRIHYAQEKKFPNSGSIVFGVEVYLQATIRADAETEFVSWLRARVNDPLQSNFKLLEIRWLTMPR